MPGWLVPAGAAATFLPLVAFERLQPLRPETESKPRRIARNLVIAGLAFGVIGLLQTPLLGSLWTWMAERRIGLLNLVEWPRTVEVVLAVLLLDYTLWHWHWLNHRVPFLWRFHLVHHADGDLDASTALRFHFGEMALSVPYRALQVIVIGADAWSLGLWQALLLPSILFHHSNVRLPLALERWLVRMIVTPRMHGIHHSTYQNETNSNWSSLLSAWDYLHGTARLNVPQRAIEIGVPAYARPEHRTLGRMLALPFRRRGDDWVAPDGDHRVRPPEMKEDTMRPTSLSAVVTLATVLACPLARAQDTLRVGTASASRGEAASGWIEVADAGDAGTRIPVTVVHGAKPGPVLALVAGTHGYEYTSVLALPRVRARLDPARMAGSVILVHLSNPPSFYGRRVYVGPDGKNLNRMYPGRRDGTVSERIAEAITREVVTPATHLVDMHCGDGNESLRPYAYATVTGDEALDRAIRELALAYGLERIVAERSRPSDPAASVYLENTAVLRGKPAITTESGGLGMTDEESVAAHEKGALSVIAHLGIQDLPSARVASPTWIDRTEIVRAKTTGLWYRVVEKTQTVAAGALLGRVHDPFGAVVEEVRAPFGGELLYVVGTPPVTAGEPLAFVGQARGTR